MADEKKTAGEKAVAAVLPPSETPESELVDYVDKEPAKVVPKKADAGYDTPSGYALATVGDYTGDPGTEEAREHGLKYLAAKTAKRWGYGA